jgi:phosphoribosylamine--glycine ligase
VSSARVYHAGTKQHRDGTWVTHGGRVLAVVATADTREQAAALAHREAGKVQFPGAQRRSDIGIKNF